MVEDEDVEMVAGAEVEMVSRQRRDLGRRQPERLKVVVFELVAVVVPVLMMIAGGRRP